MTRGPYTDWTKYDEVLRYLWGHWFPAERIAALLGVTPQSVYNRAFHLGLPGRRGNGLIHERPLKRPPEQMSA